MALIRNQDRLKLADRKGAGRDGKADKLWMIGKSENVGSKTGKKLIAGEIKFSKRVERGRSKIYISPYNKHPKVMMYSQVLDDVNP